MYIKLFINFIHSKSASNYYIKQSEHIMAKICKITLIEKQMNHPHYWYEILEILIWMQSSSNFINLMC